MITRPSRATIVALTLTAALTAACSSSGGAATPPPARSAPATNTTADTPPSTAAGSPAAYPLTIDNCGRTLRFDAVPRRVVSLWPSITEMVIALGAGDRLAGQAFTDQSPPLQQYRAQYDKVKVLASNAVSREVLLNARPDLVIADGEYHFNGTELPTIADLAKLGIPVYIVSSFCNGAVTTGKVKDVFTDLDALGSILDAPGTASSLSTALTRRLDATAAKVKDAPAVPLVLCQIYDKALYAEAEGLYSDVVGLAGGTNLYDGQLPKDQYYAQVSTEDVIKKNPGTIVYLYNSAADRAGALSFLKKTFATVDAVRNGRLIALPSVDFIDMRAVDGVTDLAAALHP